MARTLVFICGIGRSGTSALVRLLNAHPLVCIGLERYKRTFQREQFDPDLFRKERFFQFSEEDTNILPSRSPERANIYAAMEKKWDNAQIVGDKLPQVVFQADKVEAAFPGCRWLYIVRQVVPMALSWDARAKNEKDQWPRRDDFFRAVERWNKANQIALEMSRAPNRSIHTVCYERLFSGDRDELRAIIEFLGLDLSPEVESAHQQATTKYLGIVAKKDRSLTAEQQEFAQARADMGFYLQLIGDG